MQPVCGSTVTRSDCVLDGQPVRLHIRDGGALAGNCMQHLVSERRHIFRTEQ